MFRREESSIKPKRPSDKLKSKIEKGIKVSDLGIFETTGLDSAKKDYGSMFKMKKGVQIWFLEVFWAWGWQLLVDGGGDAAEN